MAVFGLGRRAGLLKSLDEGCDNAGKGSADIAGTTMEAGGLAFSLARNLAILGMKRNV